MLLYPIFQEIVFNRDQKKAVAHCLWLNAIHECRELRLVDVVERCNMVANFVPFFIQCIGHLPRCLSSSVAKEWLCEVLCNPYAKLG